MERFITDERTGLRYELVGDYYLIAGDDEPEGVMSRVMRKIDFGIWQKSITGGGLTAPWLLFSRQGAKGQGRRYAARLALDAL